MSPSLESEPTPLTSGESRPGETTQAPLLASFLRLIDSRLALIQLESADAGQHLMKKFACFAGACFCLFSAWILLVAATIKFVSDATNWPWSWTAFGLAIIHLLLGIVLSSFKSSGACSSFPATRAEFKKDREWIENFSSRKSND